MAHVWLSLKVIIGIHAIRINVHWAIQENDMIHGLMTFRWPHIWLDVEHKSVHWEFQVGWAYPITNHQPKAPVVLAEMQTRPSSLKRVKQTPNISQNKIVCGFFCGIGILWWFFAELTWISFSRFCRRELCHPRETCLNASREYFPRFPRRTVKHCKVFLHLYQHHIQAPQNPLFFEVLTM